MRAVISTKTFSSRGGYTFITSLKASCNTMRKDEAAPIRPREDGCHSLERLRYAPCTWHAPLVLTVPAWHTRHLPAKMEMRRPGPHDWKACALESSSNIMHQCDRSWVFFGRRVSKSFHLEQRFPHSALSSSIPPVSGVPKEHDAFSAISTLPTNESKWAEAQWGVRS